MNSKVALYVLFLMLVFPRQLAMGQESPYQNARSLTLQGNFDAAKGVLSGMDKNQANYGASVALLGRIHTREGNYEEARKLLNRISSREREHAQVWIAAVENELYASNEGIALGLANKALSYLGENDTIVRLRQEARRRILTGEITPLPQYGPIILPNERNTILTETETTADQNTASQVEGEQLILPNRIELLGATTVFDAVYDPMFYSSITYRRQTNAGVLMPRVNYSNRLGSQGLQYEIDFYPRFSKRFYAYMNYGYSDAPIYPVHRLGGDLYANLPGAFEFSAGARYLSFDVQNVTVITNSLGHYRGNYYFSLRTYVTPQPNQLTQVSGSLVVRKYYRDAENFLGIELGMGYAPELQQLRDGGELLAETLLYIESQRVGFQYQWTPKKGPNIYLANLGVARQELTSGSNDFFWAVSAGLTYGVKF